MKRLSKHRFVFQWITRPTGKSHVGRPTRSTAIGTCLLVFAAAPYSLAAENGASGPAASLLRRCLSTQARMDRVSMRVLTDIKLVPLDDRPRHHQVNFLYRREGALLDVSGQYLFLDKQQDTSYQFRSVVNSDLWISYTFRFSEVERPRGGIASLDRSKYFELFAGTPNHSGVLDGYLFASGRKRLAQLMLEAGSARVAAREAVAGIRCDVVEASTRYGHITLWLAPGKGSIPHRVVYKKDEKDLFNSDKPISEQPVYAGLHGGQRMIGWSCVLDQVTAQKIEDVYVPVSGRVTETHYLSAGRNLVNVFTYQRSHVELEPDFHTTDAFRIDLPEGVRVTNADEADSGVVYQWRDGEIRPAYAELVGAATGLWEPRRLSITILWSVGAVALVFVGARLLRRSLRRAT